MVWYSHLLQNFPQFIVIHTVKGFGIVNKAEIDVFNVVNKAKFDFFKKFSSCFYYLTDVGNLISYSAAFSKSKLYIWKITVHILLNPSLKDF